MKPGTECIVNGMFDLGIDPDAREFIGQECIFIKVTKAGLFQVALKDQPKKVYSMSKRNITFKGNIV